MDVESQSVTPPRSVIFALWARNLAAGSALLPDAVRAIRGEDEPHTLAGDVGELILRGEDDDAVLRKLVSSTADDGISVAAVIPAPGDPTAVPVEASYAAMDAGECVLVESTAATFALVPTVERFGSDWEPGHLVTWTRIPVSPWAHRFLGIVGDVAEADRDLRTALLSATQALSDLDVARWREDVGDELAALRGEDLGWPLPPRLDGRTARVVSLATRLRRIVELAAHDDGGASSLWQADQRGAALGEVERAARRALSAASLTQR